MRKQGQYFYRVFDSVIQSNIILTELSPVNTTAIADYRFSLLSPDSFDSATDWQQTWEIEDVAWLHIGHVGDRYLLRFPDIADFYVSSAGLEITCRPHPHIPNTTIRHLLLDQVLPLIVAHRGRLVVHGSAIKLMSGAGISFVGASGRGKSTLSAGMAQYNNAMLLTDDGVLIDECDGQLIITPSYHGLRLLQDSEHAVFGGRSELRDVAHYAQKKRVVLPVQQTQSAPLMAMYFLVQNDSDSDIEIKLLNPRDAFLALVQHSFCLDIKDHERLKQSFTRFTALSKLPLFFQLQFPHRLEQLPQLCNEIVAHAQSLNYRSTATVSSLV